MALAIPIKQQINQYLESQHQGWIDHLQPVSGGCICENYLLRTSNGERLFLKTGRELPQRLFHCEATGLGALAAQTSLKIPRVIHAATEFLLLEYIPPGRPGPHYWQQLAEGLAQLHQHPQTRFGFTEDNFCGRSAQPNPSMTDGFAFFAEHRLRYQAQFALKANRLGNDEIALLEKLIEGLRERLPAQPPALIHGDLWSGNIYCDENGGPVLIDPACYWGWREADIAMTQLFGALPDSFYQHYQHCLPMPPEWQQRMPLYNLYHLLNHLNLFGGSYRHQVRNTLLTLIGDN